MIELSSSWELQGRRKLSDVLFIKEVQLDNQCCDDEDIGGDLAVDVSCEFASKPVILQPYLHPEVSSAGPCCIMIRLSTQRNLRIVQVVLISSSSHIDFVDRYGEALARIEGVTVPGLESLFRCSSGRLSPHTECVVRFSEVHHLDSLVIQHIGVYTVCPVSSLTSFTEPSESHTQEIIKLSSFLGSSPHQAIASARPDSQSNHQRLYKCITTSSVPTVESQRGKSASSPAVISGDKDVVAPTGEKLHTLCSQFLTSLYQPQRPPEFWEKCATSLFAILVQLSVGEFASERRQQDFYQQMRGVLEGAINERQREQQARGTGGQEPKQQGEEQDQCLGSSSQSTMSPHCGVSSASTISSLSHSCPRTEDSVAFSICTLSASLDEIRQSTTAQLHEIYKRLSCLEQNKKLGD